TGGRLFTIGNSVASESYQYDVMGRVLQCSDTIAGNTFTLGYKYNLDGTTASITYPSGRTVNKSYDSIGRLTQVGSGGTALLNIASYNTAGQIVSITYGNGVNGTYGFNNQLQLSSVAYRNSSSTLLNLAYNYGGSQDNGQILGVTDNLVPS